MQTVANLNNSTSITSIESKALRLEEIRAQKKALEKEEEALKKYFLELGSITLDTVSVLIKEATRTGMASVDECAAVYGKAALEQAGLIKTITYKTVSVGKV